MRALAGGVAAVITIVLVFFGFGLRGNSQADARQAALAQQPGYAQPAPDARVQPANGFVNGAQVVPVSAAQNEGFQQAAGQQPLLVNCGPGTQTLVRQAWMNGQPVSQVECVGAAGGVVYPQQPVRPVQYGSPVYDARMSRPASYGYQRPAARRVERPRRSWQKTALVIGGSTAGAAGIGGLIGGKKGALIGAALGGGASTIYEATKRR